MCVTTDGKCEKAFSVGKRVNFSRRENSVTGALENEREFVQNTFKFGKMYIFFVLSTTAAPFQMREWCNEKFICASVNIHLMREFVHQSSDGTKNQGNVNENEQKIHKLLNWRCFRQISFHALSPTSRFFYHQKQHKREKHKSNGDDNEKKQKKKKMYMILIYLKAGNLIAFSPFEETG